MPVNLSGLLMRYVPIDSRGCLRDVGIAEKLTLERTIAIMSNGDKLVYLTRQRERYRELISRKEKSDLITEVSNYLQISRDHAIRCLNGKSQMRQRKPGPEFRYGLDLLVHLKKLYFLMRRPCSKRMSEAMSLWLPFYERHVPNLSPQQKEKLLAMSPSSIDRLLARVTPEHGLATTRAPTSAWYKTHVPIRAKDWNIKSPGHLQGDTVSHCGDSGAGIFASTLTLTDIDSGWTENKVFLTKSAARVREALEEIEKGLPFQLHSIKFDSGSEFMNFGVISFLKSTKMRTQPIEVYRSRPYRKNDQCYVEQKNFTHVRDLFGYDRVESFQIVQVMNEIYRSFWNPLQNHFMPAMKLLHKERIGSRIKKKYDIPKTPYQRLMESADLNQSQKFHLEKEHEKLDPIHLQLCLETKLREYFDLISKTNADRLKIA